MGLGKIGNSLAERAVRYIEATGKRCVLETKPKIPFKFNPQEMRCEMAFGKPVLIQDPTLNPEFLKSLLEIKGTGEEKVKQIAERMLQTLGYDPSLLKFEFGVFNSEVLGGINHNFQFKLTKKFVSMSNEELIPAVRHEIDHLIKKLGVIKAEGIEKYKEAVNKSFVLGFGQDSVSYVSFDDELLKELMSKFKKLKFFDSKKYLNALENYSYMSSGNDFNTYIKYLENDLEKSAYSIQERVGKFYNPNYSTDLSRIADFKSMDALMDDLVIPEEQRRNLYYQMIAISGVKLSPFYEKILSLLKKQVNKTITEAEDAELLSLSKKISDLCGNPDFMLKVNEHVKKWLIEGVRTKEDLARKIGLELPA